MSSLPVCIPKKTSVKILSIIAVIVIIIPLISYYGGYKSGDKLALMSESEVSPQLDGKISASELGGYTVIPQYFDVDDTKGNADGYNYLYVGQNESDVFITIDLCSDREENNIDWLGLFLNTNTDEKFSSEEDFLSSPYSHALFYNLKTNETFGNAEQYIWDIDGEPNLYDIPFPYGGIDLIHGQLVDMPEYQYYNFTSDWYGGIREYNDKTAAMIYAEQVPYNETNAFGLNIQILSQFLLGDEEENSTISAVEFNASFNVYNLFPDIPRDLLPRIIESSKISIDVGVIPMITYNYSQRNSLSYIEKEKAFHDLYGGIGSYFIASLHNPCIDNVITSGMPPDVAKNVTDIFKNLDSIAIYIQSPTDYLLGHDSLLEDGVLKKTIASDNYSYFIYSLLNEIIGGTLGTFSIHLNLEKTIEQNNGWLNFTFIGADFMEDFFTDADLPLGMAIDYFTIRLNTSDYFDPDPIGITTLENASVYSSFSPSPNCPSPHRIVEIAIPRSDLKGYDGKNLRILVTGNFGDFLPNASSYGYEAKSPISLSRSYIFGAINSGSNVYFDSDNYYIVSTIPMKNRRRI